MSEVKLSRFSDYSWLAFRMTSDAAPSVFSNELQSRCHMVSLMARGSQSARWVTRGQERRWQVNAGTVNFYPCDGEHHSFVMTREAFIDMPVFLIPDGQLRACLDSDECEFRSELRHFTWSDDAVLQSCLRSLATTASPDLARSSMRREDAARRLVLRLVELNGGRSPEWYADNSVFDRRTMSNCIEYIDAHLGSAPALSDMAVQAGLSPSHFARKFRQSTGLSLHRFVNLRRVQKALDTLKTNGESLTEVSLQLGFSSHSHFTRLFSGLTGMTPAKYQKRFRRVVG